MNSPHRLAIVASIATIAVCGSAGAATAAPPTPPATSMAGLPLLITYGPDRASTSVVAAPGATPSVDQQAFISDAFYVMPGAYFPTTPVGLGATWTSQQLVGVEGIITHATVSSTLVSVVGDQFTVSSTTSVDVATVPPTDWPDDVTSATGTFTETAESTGSLTNAMQYRETSSFRVQISLTYSDGTTMVIDATGSDNFEESPL